MKKIILLALLTVVGMLGVSQMALADNSILSVLPASQNSTVGAPFNVSLQLNPASNKVCVVQGTLSFSNLSCQSITVASGIMAQIAPTCASPSFMLGIPGCATTAQNLLSSSVEGTQAGQASLSITGIDVIGTSADVPSTSQAGNYNITNIATAQTTAPATTPKTTPVTTVILPVPSAQQAATPAQETTQQPSATGQQASLATTSPARTITIIVIVLLAIIIIGGAWYFFSKKKKNK